LAKVDAYGGAAARADPGAAFAPLPSLSAAGLVGPVPPVTWQNPILPVSAPDPGVLKDGDDYDAVATGGDKEGAFIIRHSTDLVHWEKVGDVFPNGKGPRWASGSFWAAGKENQQPGRRMMLDEIHCGADGWPVINDGTPSSGPMSSAP
jgi:hypothetical protein